MCDSLKPGFSEHESELLNWHLPPDGESTAVPSSAWMADCKKLADPFDINVDAPTLAASAHALNGYRFYENGSLILNADR